MTTRRVAVIGGGVAGVSAALAACRRGAETTLLDSSDRVGLSKSMMPFTLSDGWTEDDLILPQAKTIAVEGVEFRSRETVTSVRRERGKVRLETTSGFGGYTAFDSAVVCTGATGQFPRLRGASKQNVFVLRALADYLWLAKSLGSLDSVVVSGPIPLALKLGETLAARGKRVTIYCGKTGLERQFSGPFAEAIRRKASARFEAGRLLLVDGPLDSILGVERAEAVASGGVVRTCDAVVLVPTGVPSVPVVDCQRGRNGGLLVDLSMSTSLPGVFAAGDSAEIRFKSGSVSARLHSTSLMGGEVAGANAAGGRASAAPSWSVEQTYFGLEFCSAGLGGEEAAAMGLDVATQTESIEAPIRATDRSSGILVSIVYDTKTHQVYGLQVAGWRASSLSSAASLIVSAGLRVEQLLHTESPYSPGVSFEASPIALTAGKILAAEGA